MAPDPNHRPRCDLTIDAGDVLTTPVPSTTSTPRPHPSNFPFPHRQHFHHLHKTVWNLATLGVQHKRTCRRAQRIPAHANPNGQHSQPEVTPDATQTL